MIFKFNKYKIEMNYFYSLEDCMESCSLESFPYVETEQFTDLIQLFEITNVPNNEIRNNLWMEFYALFYKHNVIKIEKECDEMTPNNDEVKNKFKEWFIKFCSLVQRTSPYYETLLKTYDDNKNNLLNQVKSLTNSLNKFNDTPQIAGDVESDSFTTNLTKSSIEVSSDINTLMSRINEIQIHYRNLLKDWINELMKLTYNLL